MDTESGLVFGFAGLGLMDLPMADTPPLQTQYAKKPLIIDLPGQNQHIHVLGKR